MNPVDLLILVLLLLGVLSGARAGFFGPVIGLIGAVGGFAIAILLSTLLRDELARIEQPMRAIVTLGGLGFLVLSGEAIGATFGSRISHGMRRSALGPVDALGGAFVGAAHVMLLVWLVGGMIGAGMAPWIGPSVRDSVALRLTDALLPPPLTVAGRLLGLLDSTDLPPLFGGLEPIPAAPVDLPADAETQALARSAIASTARIAASGCGPGTSVGSGFFVGPAHVVTNAHVVAGSETTTVSVGGATFDAVVVAFDAGADLALLHASGAAVPSLELLATTPGRGSTGAILGYPGGGALTVTAGAITATHDVVGPDIYGQGGGDRSVVELRAAIRRGNSGGPLVVEPGMVGAVVFGASRLDSDVGYAIGSDQAFERLGPFIGATAAVGTGSCL
jgi:uncharacterized membrane protein required for colicin V production